MKNFSLLSLLLVFTFSTGLMAQSPGTPEEIEAFKLQLINNPYDTKDFAAPPLNYAPESLTDFNLQFFYELPGQAGEACVGISRLTAYQCCQTALSP